MSRRLLLLNWRDPWHPQAGGAELLTLRILERLASSGWDIEWFSGSYPGAAPTSEVNGITYIREGGQLSVHLRAYRRYRKATDFDIIVDEINTIPFMTPLYSRVPHVAFINQLARGVWRHEAGLLVGSIGEFLEPFYLRPYRNVPIISISPSSIDSLRDIGMRGPMHLIPMSVDEIPDEARPVKNRQRDIVVLGRVTPSKRIEESIDASVLLAQMGWEGELLIIGSGREKYVSVLQARAQSKNAPVRFMGYLSNDQRRDLLRTCSVLWMTSIREGWGLVVTEAARHWTPSVVYNVPGLCDAVIHGKTGYVTDQSPASLAASTRHLLEAEYEAISLGAFKNASELSWDKTAEACEGALRSVIDVYNNRR